MKNILFIIICLLNISMSLAQTKSLYLGGPDFFYPSRPRTGNGWTCDDIPRPGVFDGAATKSGQTYWYIVNGGPKTGEATIPANVLTTYTVEFMTDSWNGKLPALGWCTFDSKQVITQNDLVTIVEYTWLLAEINICVNAPVLDLSQYLKNGSGAVISGNGITGTNFNPTTAGVGKHLIQATKVFDNGTALINLMINVNATPAFDFFPPVGVCSDAGEIDLTKYVSNTNVTFNGTGVTGTKLSPGNLGATTSITATFTAGCTGFITKTINIVPAFSVSAGLDETVCINSPSLTLSSGLPATGTWSGLNITGNIFSTQGLGSGTYIANYTVDNGGCVKMASKRIIIPPVPSILVGNDISVCMNDEPISLIAAPVGGLWSGPGVTGDILDPKGLTLGSNNIKYTIVNGSCTYSEIRKINAYAVPASPIVIGNTPVCLGDTLHLTASSPGSNIRYNWYKDGSTGIFATGNKLNYKLLKGENIYVQAQNIYNCSSTNKTLITLTASGFPGVKISSNKTLIGIGEVVKFSINTASTTYKDITWDFGDSTTSKEFSPAHYYYDLDTFNVRAILVSPLGCASEIVSPNLIKVKGIPRQVITGIETLEENNFIEDYIYAYPLPIDGDVKLFYSLSKSQVLILEIINEIGQTVFTTSVQGKSGNNEYSFMDNQMFSSKGIYFLTFRGVGINKSVKLIK